MEPGKLYFFTASILKWMNILRNDDRKRIILDSLAYLHEMKLATISGFVIMPNHIHMLWRPLDDRLQLRFMKYTAQQLKFHLKTHDNELLDRFYVDKKDRSFQIWQRNPLAIELYTREVAEQKLDYIHNNPCNGKWHLANDPIAYPFSSIRYYEDEDKTNSFLTHYLEIIG